MSTTSNGEKCGEKPPSHRLSEEMKINRDIKESSSQGGRGATCNQISSSCLKRRLEEWLVTLSVRKRKTEGAGLEGGGMAWNEESHERK